MQYYKQDKEGRGRGMMNHKHYTFQLVDQTPKEKLPNGNPFVLGMYLKAKMYFYIAQNKLQSSVNGDEQDYINMLLEEYISAPVSHG